MRSLLGLIQFVFGIGGVIALFTGQWALMIVAWVGAFAVGWIGNRIVKAVMGVSQSGQEALSRIGEAIQQLERGAYTAAEGTALGAINSFRLGGDKHLLPLPLTVRAVALGANSKFDAARKAIDEAEEILRNPPLKLQEMYDDLRPMILVVQRELRSPYPDTSRLVADFLAGNAS